jgi:hypothetical protein
MNDNLKAAVQQYLKSNATGDKSVMIVTWRDRVEMQGDISKYPTTIICGNTEDALAENIRQCLAS